MSFINTLIWFELHGLFGKSFIIETKQSVFCSLLRLYIIITEIF